MAYEEYKKEVMTNLAIHGGVARVSWFLGVIFTVLGVVSEVTGVTLGLNRTSWLLLAIVACLLGIVPIVAWAMGLYVHSLESKKKDK